MNHKKILFLILVSGIFFIVTTNIFSQGDKEGKENKNMVLVASGDSTSPKVWTGGDEESPLMHPGGNCIDCHSENEGPDFTIAGTVYSTPDAKTDEFGVNGAKIVIIDAANKVLEMTTNEAGNFFSWEKIKMPFTAKVVYMGKELAMPAQQSIGNCALCHTSAKGNGTPGRIVIP